MGVSKSLPVITPAVAGQRWSCHSCGNCCRTLVVHLTEGERKRLDEQGWKERLGVAPYVRVGRGWALNKREGGDCVFLDENNRCMIHTRSGEDAKPCACRMFPYSVRPVPDGWQASIRFDCPSVARSKGKPIAQDSGWLMRLAAKLEHSAPEADDVADLDRGVQATPDEIAAVLGWFMRWIRTSDRPALQRLLEAAHVTVTLQSARLRKVRGPRLTELLDLLFGALPGECVAGPEAATARQRGLLRQLAFAHAEHLSLADMREGVWSKLRRRRQQLTHARRFRKGTGSVPQLPGISGQTSFEQVESIAAATDRGKDIEELVCRYLGARLGSRSVFGHGYYRWPVFNGLGALWLSTAVIGWLARYSAAAACPTAVSFDDVALAVGIVDRAATRLPVLGTLAERARLTYLTRDAGVGRLIRDYWPIGDGQ